MALTISLSKATSVAAEAVVVHALDHHGVALQIVSDVVSPPAAVVVPTSSSVLQPIDLLLPLLGLLLRLLERLLELIDFAVLLGVAHSLLALLSLV